MATNSLRKLGMRLRSNMDRSKGLKAFNSEEWYKRRDGIALGVKNRQADAHAKAVLRKELLKPGSQQPKEVKESQKIVEQIKKRKAKALKK